MYVHELPLGASGQWRVASTYFRWLHSSRLVVTNCNFFKHLFLVLVNYTVMNWWVKLYDLLIYLHVLVKKFKSYVNRSLGWIKKRSSCSFRLMQVLDMVGRVVSLEKNNWWLRSWTSRVQLLVFIVLKLMSLVILLLKLRSLR